LLTLRDKVPELSVCRTEYWLPRIVESLRDGDVAIFKKDSAGDDPVNESEWLSLVKPDTAILLSFYDADLNQKFGGTYRTPTRRYIQF
jgi:hypothetical protein